MPEEPQLIRAKTAAADDVDVEPFLRWPGGKRWLVDRYRHLFPPTYGTYIEPFAGAGSVFFKLLPPKAILADSNADLMSAYQAIKNDPDGVYGALALHASHHSSDYYYKVRAAEFEDIVDRAARLIYLNRTCFNGIYRVNRNGDFNVPIGNPRNLPGSLRDLVAASRALAGASLLSDDFYSTLTMVTPGDLVYLDPPYTVHHNRNGFLRYNERLFSWADQVRLAEYARAAVDIGAVVIVSNAFHESVTALYTNCGYFDVHQIVRYSAISAQPRARSSKAELLAISRNAPRQCGTRP